MKTFFLLAFLFLNTSTFAQQHNDLKEYGYKGRVKRLTTFTYDSTKVNQQTRRVINPKTWNYKVVTLFDRDGNFDTTYSFIRIPIDPENYYESKTLVIKTIGRDRYLLNYHGVNEVADTQTCHWIDDTTYIIYGHSSDNSSQFEATTFLNKDYRDKAGRTETKEKGVDLFRSDYANVIGRDNLFTKSFLRGNGVTGTVEVNYLYPTKDKNGNPTKIIRVFNKGKCDITVREFEYW